MRENNNEQIDVRDSNFDDIVIQKPIDTQYDNNNNNFNYTYNNQIILNQMFEEQRNTKRELKPKSIFKTKTYVKPTPFKKDKTDISKISKLQYEENKERENIKAMKAIPASQYKINLFIEDSEDESIIKSELFASECETHENNSNSNYINENMLYVDKLYSNFDILILDPIYK